LRIAVLDHGYVELIEVWGTGRDGIDCEAGIIEAARQSTQGSFRGWDQDAKLLAHLYGNNHATPFEFAGMVIEVQAPIFVFREWHRHRTQSYNEMSARYAPLPDLHYEPDRAVIIERGRAVTGNKQAAGVAEFRESAVDAWRANLADQYRAAEQVYRSALASGIPKELARLSMPVGHYSRMRAQATLRNWLAFLTLRMDPNAQWEIRQFANAVGEVISEQFPQTWRLFRGAHPTPAEPQ
jgi:thymidylate synthase (FAD)